MLGDTVVNVDNTTQHCMPRPTSEAKYVTMPQGTNITLFTRAMLELLQPQRLCRAMGSFEDNQRESALAETTRHPSAKKNSSIVVPGISKTYSSIHGPSLSPPFTCRL